MVPAICSIPSLRPYIEPSRGIVVAKLHEDPDLVKKMAEMFDAFSLAFKVPFTF